MAGFKCKIVSQNKILFDGEISYLHVPSVLGSFGILKDHAPIMAVLNKGKIFLRRDVMDIQKEEISDNTLVKELEFEIPLTGIIEVKNNNASVLII